jgi:hypothetical protein
MFIKPTVSAVAYPGSPADLLMRNRTGVIEAEDDHGAVYFTEKVHI